MIEIAGSGSLTGDGFLEEHICIYGEGTEMVLCFEKMGKEIYPNPKIRWKKDVPRGFFLIILDFGFLGRRRVICDKLEMQDFFKERKPEKNMTRYFIVLVEKILSLTKGEEYKKHLKEKALS
jgi:hypothetical protein